MRPVTALGHSHIRERDVLGNSLRFCFFCFRPASDGNRVQSHRSLRNYRGITCAIAHLRPSLPTARCKCVSNLRTEFPIPTDCGENGMRTMRSCPKTPTRLLDSQAASCRFAIDFDFAKAGSAGNVLPPLRSVRKRAPLFIGGQVLFAFLRAWRFGLWSLPIRIYGFNRGVSAGNLRW